MQAHERRRKFNLFYAIICLLNVTLSLILAILNRKQTIKVLRDSDEIKVIETKSKETQSIDDENC